MDSDDDSLIELDTNEEEQVETMDEMKPTLKWAVQKKEKARPSSLLG